MTIISGDTIAMATAGVLEDRSISSRPNTPTLSVTLDGTTVTATIAGDAGVTNFLKYKGTNHSSWQDGGSREGNGELVVSGLSNDVPYIFIAYSQDSDGIISLPSVAMLVTAAADTDNEFDDIIDDVAEEMLEQFAEDIKYIPAGGGVREIAAIVQRQNPQQLGSAPHGLSQTLVVSVANNSVTGISSSEVDTGGDKIEVPFKIGKPAQTGRITKIVSQNHGFLKLEVRR